MNWSKYFSSVLDSFGHRLLKVSGYGTATADQVAPFGDDSCPVQGMDAIYCETDTDEQPLIMGYVNTNCLAGEGEKRFFSIKKNEDGSYSQAFYTWMKADGTYEIGGNTDNLIRYTALNEALQAQITKMEVQLGLIAAGIATAGGSYTPGDISLDISTAKIAEVKCTAANEIDSL
jgi:hypothetical protein